MNENQVPTTPENNTTITPIPEVKIEVAETPTPQNIEPPVENKSQEVPKTEPPKNDKVSTILLILLFVFLFAFIMGMPYIREFTQKLKADKELAEIEKQEEEDQEEEDQATATPTPTPEASLQTVTCTKIDATLENYTLTESQVFEYNTQNQVLKSKMTSEYNFTVIDNIYNELQQQCSENSLKYLTTEGYTLACSNDENIITMSHEFDLETFTTIVDGTTTIEANATYQASVDTIKNNLIGQGYTCE